VLFLLPSSGEYPFPVSSVISNPNPIFRILNADQSPENQQHRAKNIVCHALILIVWGEILSFLCSLCANS
jgi:hypothetical protein